MIEDINRFCGKFYVFYILNFENRLRFDKVIADNTRGNFLRHSVETLL